MATEKRKNLEKIKSILRDESSDSGENIKVPVDNSSKPNIKIPIGADNPEKKDDMSDIELLILFKKKYYLYLILNEILFL